MAATAPCPVIYAEEVRAGGVSTQKQAQESFESHVLPTERLASEGEGKKLLVVQHYVLSAAPTLEIVHGEPPSARPEWIEFGALMHPLLRLQRPIRLQVSSNEGMVSVFWREGTEFGYGQTMSEALDDFGRTLAELYSRLNEPNVQLSSDLQETKQLLCAYIESRPR